MNNLYTKQIGAGFSHSVAICEAQNGMTQLMVWGDNSKNEISSSKNKIISDPFQIKLTYTQEALKTPAQVYNPFDVACGPSYTLVVAQKNDEECLTNDLEDQDHIQIMKQLRQKILGKDGKGGKPINKLFVLNEDQFGLQQGANQNGENDDPFGITVESKQFDKNIKLLTNNNQTSKINMLFKCIQESSNSGGRPKDNSQTSITLGDIQDYALGYRHHNIKVFAFGYMHASICNAESQKQEMGNDEEKKNVKDTLSNLQTISTPVQIVFPKYTSPIISVSCGADHCLALTIDHELYSWGSGSYGALGFKSTANIEVPTKLEIKDHKENVFQIIQIACGKYHSIVLTSRQSIYTWGKGLNGQLGLGEGNEQDVLEPIEIYYLSQRKPIFVSAGENHSAAITEKNQLYTWGNGGFGRLGHDSDAKECRPKLVEALKDNDITYVSCGAFHTLCVDSKGRVHSFGQNKYNKLGIHYSTAKEGNAYKNPVRISMYKKHQDRIDKVKHNDCVKVVASSNHSMCLSKSGKLYTWGYKGKGLLGRAECDPKERNSDKFSSIGLPIQLKDRSFKFDLRNIQRYFYEEKSLEFGLGQKKKNEFIFHQVKQICCSHQNTVALTSQGQVLMLGSNNFGQHCRDELPKSQNIIDDIKDKGFTQFSQASIIPFNVGPHEIIEYVACGAEHMFAKTRLDEIYGWGRNDEGQLGCGFITEKISEPINIEDISQKNIKQIVGSDNYSAALSNQGEVYVAGSLEGGKLGLGKGQKKGYQLTFKQVHIKSQYSNDEKSIDIDFIACGVDHMLAISRHIAGNPYSGKTYAWGKNQKGQLGIGSKENNMYEPTEIKNAKERFIKVACGHNYSIGLSSSGRVYHWGNYKFLCSIKQKQDVEEPMIIPLLENYNIQDIACCYKYCIAYTDKEEIKVWGKFLLEKGDAQPKKDNKENADETSTKNYVPMNFPQIGRRNNLKVKQLTTGPNHCAIIISDGDRVFTWGFNNTNNRLGLEKPRRSEDTKLGIYECARFNKFVSDLNSNAEQIINNGGGQEAEQDLMEDEFSHSDVEEQIINADDINIIQDKSQDQANSQNQPQEVNNITSGTKEETKKSAKRSVHSAKRSEVNQIAQNQKDITLEIIQQIGNHNTKAKKDATMKQSAVQVAIRKMCIFDINIDISVLEFIRQELSQKQQPQIKNITKQLQPGKAMSIMDQNLQLYSVIKSELQLRIDEQSILDMDIQLRQLNEKIMKSVISFAKQQQQVFELRQKAITNLLGRIIEVPFKVDTGAAFNIKNASEQIISRLQKKQLKEVLRLIYLHPCYLIKILKSEQFAHEDKKLLIQQLFNSNSRTTMLRNNYLLLSIFDDLVKFELSGKYIEEIELCGRNPKKQQKDLEHETNVKPLISTLIFEHIFDSQSTNIDTIACIVCHFINHIQSNFQQTTSDMDGTFDVYEDLNKEKDAGNKRGKAAAKSAAKGSNVNKWELLQKFIEQMVEEIIKNRVLKDSAQWFSFKKQTVSQLEYIKKQFKNYQTAMKKVLENENMPLQDKANKQANSLLLAGVDAEQVKEKYPSFRFSEEVYFMVQVLSNHLKDMEMNYSGEQDKQQLVSRQILGLVFKRPMEMVWQQRTIYLYPYIAKIKLLTMVEDGINSVHELNVTNAITAFGCFVQNEDFPKKEGQTDGTKEQKIYNGHIKELFTKTHTELLRKFLTKGKEVSSLLSYMNFENQICHSLEQDDTRVSMSKKLIGNLYTYIGANDSEVALQSPARNDVLIRVLKMKPEDTYEALAQKFRHLPNYIERLNVKLKTRLFVPNFKEQTKKVKLAKNLSEFVRCQSCNATLLQEIAVQNFDENILLPMYEPLDNESIVSQYCSIINLLRDPIQRDNNQSPFPLHEGKENPQLLQELGMSQDYAKFLDQEDQKASRNQDNVMKQMIQNFKGKLNVEIQNIKVRTEIGRTHIKPEEVLTISQTMDVERLADMYNSDKKKNEFFITVIKEGIVIRNIIREAEEKYRQRVEQKFKIGIITQQIEKFLLPQIEARKVLFKENIIQHIEKMKDNYQFGMANQELIKETGDDTNWTNGLTQLKELRQSAKAGVGAKQALSQEQKANIRGYLQIDCKTLLKKQAISSNKQAATISKINLKELEDIISLCHVVLIESVDGQSIEFKLVFRESEFKLCGGSSVLQEHILLNFDISQSKIKDIRTQISSNKVIAEQEGADVDADAELKFDNDALSFNPELFLKLIMQMERQKSAMIQGGKN